MRALQRQNLKRSRGHVRRQRRLKKVLPLRKLPQSLRSGRGRRRLKRSKRFLKILSLKRSRISKRTSSKKHNLKMLKILMPMSTTLK